MARNAEVRAKLLEGVNGSEAELVLLLRAYEQSVAVETKQQVSDTSRADMLELAKRGSEGEAKIAEALRKDVAEFGATMGQLELYRTGASGAGTWGVPKSRRHSGRSLVTAAAHWYAWPLTTPMSWTSSLPG